MKYINNALAIMKLITEVWNPKRPIVYQRFWPPRIAIA